MPRINPAVRPVGCWGPKEVQVAIEQSSGRDRLNIHGAIDLETGQTIMKDVLTVDALSTILLLTAIETMYPGMRQIHVFLDNARYHHAKLVQAWLSRPECRIKLHFVPAYCPHLNSIERLWGLMHRNVTHNKCYATFKDFSTAMLKFLYRTCQKTGALTAMRSRTTSASSIQRNSGLSGERGISRESPRARSWRTRYISRIPPGLSAPA